MIENGSEKDFKDTEDVQETASVDDAARLKKMPSHFVYVEAPDDAGNLVRVGAMWGHASGKGFGLRLDKGEASRQLVFEHGDDLVVLQNRKRASLEAGIDQSTKEELAEETHSSFDQATHPNRVAAPGPNGPG